MLRLDGKDAHERWSGTPGATQGPGIRRSCEPARGSFTAGIRRSCEPAEPATRGSRFTAGVLNISHAWACPLLCQDQVWDEFEACLWAFVVVGQAPQAAFLLLVWAPWLKRWPVPESVRENDSPTISETPKTQPSLR